VAFQAAPVSSSPTAAISAPTPMLMSGARTMSRAPRRSQLKGCDKLTSRTRGSSVEVTAVPASIEWPMLNSRAGQTVCPEKILLNPVTHRHTGDDG